MEEVMDLSVFQRPSGGLMPFFRALPPLNEYEAAVAAAWSEEDGAGVARAVEEWAEYFARGTGLSAEEVVVHLQGIIRESGERARSPIAVVCELNAAFRKLELRA